jgi:hypothetical protein
MVLHRSAPNLQCLVLAYPIVFFSKLSIQIVNVFVTMENHIQ